jgi:hypothetical protein
MMSYYQMFSEQIGNFNSNGVADLESIQIASNGKRSVPGERFIINYGDDLEIDMVISCNTKVDSPAVSIGFYDKEQRNFAEVDNFLTDCKVKEVNHHIRFKTVIKNINFAQGNYSISVAFHEADRGKQVLFRYQAVVHFTVNSKLHGWAPIQLAPVWEYEVDEQISKN